MKRRNFLGFMVGAAASGPSIAKSASQLSMADLNYAGISLGGGGGSGELAKAPCPSDVYYDEKSWAKKALSGLLGKTAKEIEKGRRETYVGGLEPDVAVLRSMTLTSKIRLQRKIYYDRQRMFEEERLRDMIANKMKDAFL